MTTTDQMWAYRIVAPSKLEQVTVDRPTGDHVPSGFVLLRVLAGGICGSDMPYFRGAPPARRASDGGALPGFPLHEVVGEVITCPDGSLTPGSRVVGWADNFDGLAEYVVTSVDVVAPLSTDQAPELAVVAQPLACVLDAVDRMGDVAGRRCAVLGLGSIGMLFAHALKARGAVVCGIDSVDRRPLAEVWDIDEIEWATSARWADGLQDARRPDVVVESIGHQTATLTHAIAAVAPQGLVYYFGIPDEPIYPLDMELLLRNGLTLRAGGTRDKGLAARRAVNYLEQHSEVADLLVSHTFEAQDAQAAYETALRAEPGRLKVCLTMS